MNKPKIGLLALYLKLYDDTQAWLRADVEAFKEEIEGKLGETLEVVSHPICRIAGEIQEAVDSFKAQDVDAVVTVHLAYSPSLEGCEALGQANLPILVLDTTPDYSFTPVTGAGRIMQNHGIHGVQDLCSVLRRQGTPYQVFAGHYKNSPVLERLSAAAHGAMMANRMMHCRVGQIGESFAGMGDFRIDAETFSQMGISVVPFDAVEGEKRLSQIPDSEIEDEWAKDNARFNVQALPQEVYRQSARVGLAIRKWIQEQKLDALTVNFLATEGNPALPVMPFLELCKCMENGIGYAGEGDAMNAAFVAALMGSFPKTTFAEMFCPDWQDESVFCSHMGEFNPTIADHPMLLTELEFSYTSAGNTATLYGCMSGTDQAAFLNLNPISDGKFVLIAAPGGMKQVKEQAPEMEKVVRGWFTPQVPLAQFLEEYSRLGGGHHGAIVYEPDWDALASFARCMGWDFEIIR